MEYQILHWFESLHNPITDPIMYGFTFLGNAGWFWIALCVLFLFLPFLKNNRKIGFAMMIGLILSLIMCNGVMKNSFSRERCFWVPGSGTNSTNYEISTEEGSIHTFEDLYKVFEGVDDWSFPSGHTSASFAAAVAILLWDKKKGIPAVIVASFIALSRLYLTVHFPSDVLVSLVLGSIYGVLGYLLTKLLINKSAKAKAVLADGESYSTIFKKTEKEA